MRFTILVAVLAVTLALVAGAVIVRGGLGDVSTSTTTSTSTLLETSTTTSTLSQSTVTALVSGPTYTKVVTGPGETVTTTQTDASTATTTATSTETSTVVSTATSTLSTTLTSTTVSSVTSTVTTTVTQSQNSTASTSSGVGGGATAGAGGLFGAGASTTSSTTSSTTTSAPASVATIQTSGGVSTTIATSAGSIEATSVAGPQGGLPSGYVASFGAWSFVVKDVAPGSTVSITLTFPTPIPPGAVLYKYDCGSVQGAQSEQALVTGVNGNQMTISLTDGGQGDCDSVPGQITDPGTLGLPSQQAPQGVPEWSSTPLLVAVALAGMVLLRMRVTRFNGGSTGSEGGNLEAADRTRSSGPTCSVWALPGL